MLVQALTEEPTRADGGVAASRAAGRATPAGRARSMPWRRRCATRVVTPLVRFEGLPGEFSQHDFGEVRVRYQNGTEEACTSLRRV